MILRKHGQSQSREQKILNKNEAELADILRRLDTTKVAKMSRFLCHCKKKL